MKMRCERDDLAKALAVVGHHAGKSTPITHGVRIDVGKTITVTCTDIDVTCTADVAGASVDKGVVVAPVAILAKIVGVLPAGAVELIADGEDLVVSTSTDTHTLRSMPADGWPKVKAAEGCSYDLTAEHCAALRRVVPAASIDVARNAVLTCVHMAGSRAEATDSYRMHRATLDGVDIADLLIPASTLDRVLRTVGDDGATITGDENMGRLTITTQAATWTLRTGAGEFPKVDPLYESALKGSAVLTFSRDVMLDALKRVAPITGAAIAAAGNKATAADGPVHFDMEGMLLTVSASAASTGTSATTIEASGAIGPKAFNSDYFAAALAACPDDEITLISEDQHKPAVIENGGMTVLVMPVRVAS